MKHFAIVIFILSNLMLSATVQADGSKVALGGYDAVAYATTQKALYGDPKYASEFEEKIYYFNNNNAKKAFDKEPAKLTSSIKYDAYCATGVALGKKLVTFPNLFSIVDGKVYLFSAQGAKDMFAKDLKGMIAKAEANWDGLK